METATAWQLQVAASTLDILPEPAAPLYQENGESS